MEDILFFVIVAITEILATYHINEGEIRIYGLMISAIGFFVYQKTLGRMFIFFSKKILYLIRMIIYLILSIGMGFNSPGISQAAHIAGLIGGFLLAMILYRRRGTCYEN